MTGPLADVGKDTPWVDDNKLGPINKAGGLKVGSQTCKIDYKIYDSKSTVAGSAEAATQAILQDKVDFLMAQGTPDTTNAPSDLCERNKIPCIATDTPVEAWLLGTDGKPRTFKYTYEFFFSVPDILLSAIQRAGTKDRDAVLKALGMTDLDTVVGPVRFNAQHCSVQPLGGAQWRYDAKTKRLVKENVYNAVYPSVKQTGKMVLYGQ